jgi:hypothetical protein
MLLDQIAMNTGLSWHFDVCFSTRANLLVVGPPDITAVLLDSVRPHLEEPVVTLRGGEPVTLPAGPVGTLVLNSVSSLSAAEQAELNHALNGRLSGTQVISTSPLCLMPLVLEGRFLDTLYYRLNTIFVDVRESVSGL